MANRMGKGRSDRFSLLGLKITVDADSSRKIRRQLLLGRKAMTNVDGVLKSRDITLPTKVHTVKAIWTEVTVVFSIHSGHVRLWEMDCKVGRTPKNWCLGTVVLEKTPKRPLDSMSMKPVNLKGNQPWILIERTDAEAETPVFWSSDGTADSLEKSLMLGKIEGRRRRRCQRMRWWHGITHAIHMKMGKFWEMVREREAWCAAVHGVSKCWTWLDNWTKH